MNRRYRTRKSSAKEVLLLHIQSNLKEYLMITLFFLIGIIVGVIFINNASTMQKNDTKEYISSFITGLKEDTNLDEKVLLTDSIIKNSMLAILIWFMGSTVIGMPIVCLLVAFRGFCLGYTISSIIFSIGIRKGNFTFYFSNFVPKYYFYTGYFCYCGKWNEIA